MSAILLPTGGQPPLQRHRHTGQTSLTNHPTGPTQIGTKCLSHRARIRRLSSINRLHPQRDSTTMLSIILPLVVVRGGVTTPTRTKRGDGADGITNSNSSKISRISRINGEINSGVELTSKQVEPTVPVVRHGREDGHKHLKINNSSSSSSMVTIVTIRLEATTTNHSSSSPLTNIVLITRGNPMGTRQHSYTSRQWTDHHEAQGHLLYRSYSPLELTRLVMRGALLLGGSTPLRSLVGERESLRANEQGRNSHRRHGNLGTDIHLSKVS